MTHPEQTPKFDGVEVFTATRQRDRETLGQSATRWLEDNPDLDVVDYIVTQSSDSEYHCLTITFFYRHKR